MLEAPALGGRADTTGRTLTVENTLYVGICVAALAVRLAAIAGSPLTTAEAAQALPAYQLAQGDAAAAAAARSISPALLSLQSLAFWLFAGNDAWARLPVVLLTALYPLAFWLLRPLIGRPTALVASALLLLSPVWVVSGTLGLAGEVSVVGLLFCLGFAVQARARDDDCWLLGSGAALGLALAAGTEAWAALVMFGVGALLYGRRPRPSARQWRQFGAGLGASLLVFATAALCYPIGLQRTVDLAGAWAVALVQRQPYVLHIQTLLLLCYEPLLLVLALVTVALVPPTSTWRRVLYIWLGIALFLTLASGQQGGGILLLLPALAVLAAQALLAIGRRLRNLGPALLLQSLGATLVLVVYGYVALSGFAVQGQMAYLILTATAVGIGGALLGLVSVRQGAVPALSMLAMAVVMVLGAYQASATWQGALQRRALPQELTYGRVADANLADLVSDIRDLSWTRQHDPQQLPIVIENETGPLVGWYTRALRAARWMETAPADTFSAAVLTARPELATAASQYVGQDYRVSDGWLPYFSGYRSFLRWLLYREAEGATQQSVTLWVLNDLVVSE
ncbi:MAG: hypothetical protein ACYC5O_05730 [Anaerolineae bacterium]